MTVVDPRREREQQRQYARERALLKDPVRREAMAAEMTADDEQQLLLLAAELLIVSANGSWRMLHRKMRISQGHAQRVLQILEMHGIVGPEVAERRTVLVEASDLDAALAHLRVATSGDRVARKGGEGGEGGATTLSPSLIMGGEPPAATTGGDDHQAGGEKGGDHPETPAHHRWRQGGEDGGEPPATTPGVSLAKRGNATPAAPADATPATPDEDDDPPPATCIARPRRHLVGRVVQGGGQVVITLRRGEGRIVRSTRGTARYGYVAGQGVWSWLNRAAKASNFGHAREQLRMARTQGLPDEIERWGNHLEKLRNQRIKRMKDLPHAIKGVGVTALVGVAALAATLLVVGVLVGIVASGVGGMTQWVNWDFAHGWHFWWWILDWAKLIVSAIVVAGAFLALTFAIPVTVVKAHTEGHRRSSPPRWLLTRDELHSIHAEVTLDTITAAMAHMKIAALTRALKDGGVLEFIVQPREQGGGTYFQLRLPVGCIAAEFLPSAKVELLAGNLARHKHEVWPQRQADSDARVLDCWVADKGTMDRPAPAWPLLHEGEFDVFRDRGPLGVTMRRDPVMVGMLQKHWLIGANSKQGKTTLLRLILLCLALDPTVELRLADLKGDGDLRCLRNRCHTYIEGPTDEHAEAACAMLEDVLAEMKRRYEKKAQLGITGPITRAMSRRKGSGFHPIWAIVDECQVMYMMGKSADGETLIGGSKDESRAQDAAKRLHDLARAVNIHLIQATQRPDPQTMPVRVREGVHVRVCLWVPKLSAAQMILAEAADQGARPYDLRSGVDAGTAVFAGEVEDIPMGQAFTIVKSYYVDQEASEKVAKRAIEAWTRYGQSPSPLVIDGGRDPAVIDSLAHITEAMRGEDKVLTRDVLYRLKEDRMDTYGDWSDKDLSDALKEYELYGVKIRKSHGDSKVFLEDLHRALRERPE